MAQRTMIDVKKVECSASMRIECNTVFRTAIDYYMTQRAICDKDGDTKNYAYWQTRIDECSAAFRDWNKAFNYK